MQSEFADNRVASKFIIDRVITPIIEQKSASVVLRVVFGL